MNEDLKELLRLLNSHQVDYMVIGAHAVAFYGRPRLTEDLDLWVHRTNENVRRLGAALEAFGASIGEDGERRFAAPSREMVRLGVPPQMVDILNFSSGGDFEDFWGRAIAGSFEGIAVKFPAKADLITMKRAAGRPQDLVDCEKLSDM